MSAEQAARRGAVVACVAFVAAVVAAVVRAFADRWYPIGDNAYFALRSRDVLTDHHPLLGTWTSASEAVGFAVNNPGPLLFDVLALPAKVDPTLVPLGVAALVLASVGLAGACAHRVAGARGVLAVAFASAGLAWAMGPELLIDPWQPHSMLFPFLALLACTWATVAGSDGALLGSVALGSFAVQTHLSYAPLVAALGALAVAAVLARAVRRRSPGRALRVLAGAALVAAVLWAQPVVEELTGEGRGNLSRVADLAGADRGGQAGAGLAVRVVGTIATPVPRWVPPSFEQMYENRLTAPETQPVFARLVSGPVAVASLLATAAALAAAALVSRRREVVAGAAVVAVSVVAATVTAASLPLTYGLPPHHIRWLWPVAIAVTTVLAALLLARRAGVVAVTAATVVFAALAFVPTEPAQGPTADRDAGPPLRALAPQLDALRGTGPLELQTAGLRVFEPYSIAAVLELAERGVDVTVSDPVLVRQLGPSRKATGDERGDLYVLQGEAAIAGVEGAERVAFVPALDPDEVRELARLVPEVERGLRSGAIALTPDGREAAAQGRLREVEQLLAAPEGAVEGAGGAFLRLAVEEGLVAGAAPIGDALERWASLHRRFDRQTLAVWVDWAGEPPRRPGGP